MKKYLLLFCLSALYFTVNAQCDDCSDDVSIGTLSNCDGVNFNLTDIIPSVPSPPAGATYKYYEICNATNLATEIGTNCNGGNAGKCVTDFDPDEDVDNIIYIEVLDGGVCDTTYKFSLEVKPIPTIAITQSSGPSACGTTNGSITFQFTNVPEGMHTLVWDNGGSSPIDVDVAGSGNLTGLDDGAYTNFKITINGCTSVENPDAVLMDPAGPTPTITGPSTVCAGGQVTLDAGAGYSNYAWSNAGGTMQTATYMNITSSTTYTVTVTAANMCTGTDSHAVTVNSLPTATASSNSPVCEGATINLMGGGGGAGGTYSWSGPGGFTSMLQNPSIANATPSMSGNYTVTATNSNGCSDTDVVNVVVNALPIATASSNSPVCEGSTINLMGGGGGTGGTYSWSGPGGYTSNAQNPSRPNATSNMSGDYTVTVTNSSGCSDTETVTVSVTPPPTATASSNSPVCEGATINLMGGGGGAGGTYSWSGPGGYTSNAQNPSRPNATVAMSGTYTVTVTISGGCSDTETTNVVVNPNPTATATSNSPVCEGATINLMGSGAGTGGTYSWSGPGGYTSNAQNPSRPNATVAMSGTYTVSVTNSNGCTDTETTDVTVNPNPTATASSNSPVCEGDEINLTGGGGGAGGTYSWSGPGGFTSNLQNPSIPNATVAMSGTYTVTATTSNSCTDTQTTNVVVNVNPTPSSSSNSPVCTGDDIELMSSGGGAGGTYSWSGPGGYTSSAQNPIRSNATTMMAGTYTVTVTNSNNCNAISMTSVVVNARPTLVVSSSSGPTNCGGSDGEINLTFTGVPNGNHLISWVGDSQLISVTGNSGTIINLPAGNYDELMVTINNCSNAVKPSVNLMDPNAPNPGTPTGTNPTTCTGTNGTISIPGLIAGETYAVTYTDDGSPVGPINLTANGTGIVNITGLNAGVYSNFNFNLANCTGSATGSVTLSDPDSPSPGNPGKTNPSTCGGADGTITIPGLMPNTNYSVTYTDDGSLVGPMNLTSNGTGIVIIIGLNAGEYTAFSFTLNGCNGVNNTVVTLQDPNSPTCSASSNSPICEGTDLELMASTNGGGASTFQWSGPGGFSSTEQNPIRPNAVPIFSGTYNLTVTKNGCECTTSTSVVVHPEITINNAEETDPLCNGDTNGSIFLDVTGGTPPLTYTWSGGLMGNPINGLPTGTYTVTITDQSGVCTASASYMLSQPESIVINSAQIIKSCANEATGAINISVSGGVGTTYDFVWSNNATTEDLQNINAGIYTVTITDDNECTLESSHTVQAFALIDDQITGDISFCEGVGGTICAADNAIFTYEWNDGTMNQCLDVVNPGNYTVTITQNNPGNQTCTEVATANVSEIQLPNGLITSNDPDGDPADAELCLGSQAVLTANADNYSVGNLNFEWSTGSFDQLINVAATGNYEVTISESVSGLNCASIANLDVVVYIPPTVTNLEQLNGTNEINEIMFFGATIVEEDNEIVEYNWDYPADGTDQNPPPEGEQLEIIFTETGEHVICLTVIDSYGCASEIDCTTKDVKNPGDCGINSLVLSNNTLCPGGMIEITGTAERSASASQIVSFEFIINTVSQGVETVNSTATPFVVTREFGPFFNPGNYTIEFRIIDNGFPEPCSSELSKTFAVLPEPDISIAQDTVSGCAGQAIILDYTVTYFEGYSMPPLKMEIKDAFGNTIATPTTNQTGSGQMSITFQESGVYTIASLEDQTDKYCDVIKDFDSFVVSVFDAITAIEADFECDNTGATFVYSFEITGGDGNYTLISGVGPDDSIELIDGKWIYTSDTLLDGSPINVTIADGSACTNLVFNSPGSQNTCQCVLASNTGTILVDGGNGNVCESDTVFFAHDYAGIPAELQGIVEIWYYVIKTVPFNPNDLDNIVYFTQNEFISFPSGDIELNETYSIMPVIGFPDGSGFGIDFFNTTCLSFEGDAKEFRFFSNPRPQVAVDNNLICENASNKFFEAINLVGGPNDIVVWSLEGGQDKHFYPTAAEDKVYISFPDSLFVNGQVVNVTLSESKQYTSVSGVCTGDTTYSFVISDQKAPDQGLIYWWPGDILVSTIQDACYEWGYISDGTEQGLTDGNDDRFLFVPGGIPEIDQTETPEKIYFVDIFLKDGAECISANECKTRTYYNSPGPPQLQIGHGDENEFLIYPNPSENIFNLRVRGEWGGVYRLEVYTQFGQRIQSQALEKNYWTLTGEIDLSNHSSGMYYLVSTNDAGERKVMKIVKTK